MLMLIPISLCLNPMLVAKKLQIATKSGINVQEIFIYSQNKKNNVIKRNQKISLKKKRRISKGDDEPKKN